MDISVKPLIIPVFIPHYGCPHQCAFCNQTIITRQTPRLPDKTDIHDIVTKYFQYKGKREKVELAFFGGNFLGLDKKTIRHLLDMIQPYILEKKIDGIRFSTRPDTITRQTLDLLRPYTISAVELGVQSMDDDVLRKAKRGHTGMDTITAIHLLKEQSLKIGVQVMVGLPGDNEETVLKSTKKVIQFCPDFARIYPLMVLKNSRMEQWYKTGRYKPLSLEESIVLVKKMVYLFMAGNVDVIRMGLQASDMMEDRSMVLAGPWHPAFGHLVFSDIVYDTVCTKIDGYQWKNASTVILNIHPRSESRLRGDKNNNFDKLNFRYPDLKFSIRLDDRVPINQVEITET